MLNSFSTNSLAPGSNNIIFVIKIIVRIVGFLFLALLLQIPAFGQKKNYVFEQITSEAGIAFNAVSSIVEDEYGFIWFGTASGLYYYNTSEIIKYNFDPQKEDSPPSNNIINLYKDKDGLIWICTDNGLCYFNESTNSFTRLAFKESDKFLNNLTVSYILHYAKDKYLLVIGGFLYYFDRNELVIREVEPGGQNLRVSFLRKIEDGNIYVGTTDGKIFINNASISDFSLFYHSISNHVTTICYINNTIWIGLGDSGVEVVNIDGKLITQYKEEYSGTKHISGNRIRDIVKRKNGEIWIGTSQGISVIDSKGIHSINQNLHSGLPHVGAFDLYVDKNDGVWVGTWSGGLAYYIEHNFNFPHIRIIRNNETVSRSVISSFAEDKDGSIWVGIENYGLEKFNPDNMTFFEKESQTKQWPISRIKSIASDNNNQHWIGTLYEGLWSLKNNKIDRRGNISGIFSSVLAVDDGVWIGTRESGLIFYDTNKHTFKHFRAEDKTIGSLSSNRIWDIFQDSKENLWICADFGLSVKYKNATDFERFFYNENANSLSRNLNYTITENTNGNIWIGTAGAGIDIYDPSKGSFKKFRLNNAIKTADVYCILIDHQGNKWFSTNQGIYVYYAKTNTLRKFTEKDGILGRQYHPNSGFISSSGKLFFGGGNGFNMIDPTTVKQNPLVPDVFLSKILINNKSLEEQTPMFVNSKFPAAIKNISLDYNQNSLTMGFVATNFIKSSGNKFRYRMKNYQDEWIETAHGSDVTFTKIPPGNYILEVLASNNDGLWSTNAKEIQIKIYPPFWLSWYADLFYGILLTTGFFIILREFRFREKSRADEILFSEKTKFFTNVSHEFRTPLTLIISPLNNLMKKFMYDSSSLDHIKIIKRNADRLLNLTNQILDFRLIEMNKVRLKRKEEDVVSLCRNVYDCFEYEISDKQLNCIFNSSYKSFHLLIDSEKIEKTVYNLLSNALKHSQEKGQIILSLEQKTLDENSYSKAYSIGHKFWGESLEIKVRNHGKGIKKDIIPNIFDRFFTNHENEETGTGIGLHICQEYIRLHNGNIMVVSEEGFGAEFIVNLPIEHNTEFEKEDMIIQYHFDKTATGEQEISPNTDLSKPNKMVLFAEDNDELRVYFKNILSSRFKVLTAKNGKQAFEIAREVIPDIIISDILMPGMDGLELTDMIRKTTKTNHIPIILLTALSEEKYKIDSMGKGANDFITKPVDESFLFAKIDNIFRARETLKEKLEGPVNEQFSIPDFNTSFIDRAKIIVDKNLQNSSFEITDFATQLSMSRSSLQRNLKTEVNLSPTEFIRDIRLKKAVELMKSSSYNIDEIALLSGFNSSSYFIRSFKKMYGKTPSAFKSELNSTLRT